jgi:flagellar protein FlaG
MANDSLSSVTLDTRLAQGSRAPQQVEVRSVGGRPLPHGGTSMPSPPAVEVPKMDMSRAIASINLFLQQNQRGLRFQVDDSTGQTVVTVVNAESGEVVRQIPEQEVLNIAHALRASGSLLNARA